MELRFRGMGYVGGLLKHFFVLQMVISLFCMALCRAPNPDLTSGCPQAHPVVGVSGGFELPRGILVNGHSSQFVRMSMRTNHNE